MTLGEKIRKYRTLHNKTQKQLGEDVGFKKSTADVRINQYETNKMAPKSDIRSAIAAALDIDIEAISDINISSWEDIMYIFFELEEKFGMRIEKKNGRTYLSFDDSDRDLKTLITYLNFWHNQKTALVPDSETATDEQLKNYALWKSRFAKNTQDYFISKESEINAHYNNLIKNAAKSIPYAKTTSEITLLLRKIVESGFTLSTTYTNDWNTKVGPGFTFIVNELLSPPSKDGEKLFAQFRSELNHFADLGATYHSEFQMTSDKLTITYFIHVASFSVIRSQIESVIEYYNSNTNNDYLRDNFELQFQDSLKTNYNYIEDEIKIYANG